MAKETKIRRVKAKDSKKETVKEVSKKPKVSKYAAKVAGVKTKPKKERKPAPKFVRIIAKPFKFILIPFVSFGKYLSNSWKELKLVRWPTRKETWKMTGAVIGFSIVFAIFLTLIDALFEFIFTTLIK